MKKKAEILKKSESIAKSRPWRMCPAGELFHHSGWTLEIFR